LAYASRPWPTRYCVRQRPSFHSPKGTQPPIFSQCPLWPCGWMDEDISWYGSTPRPRPHCIRWGSQLSAKGAQQPPPSAHVYCGHGRLSQLLLSSYSLLAPSNLHSLFNICVQIYSRLHWSAIRLGFESVLFSMLLAAIVHVVKLETLVVYHLSGFTIISLRLVSVSSASSRKRNTLCIADFLYFL